MIRTVPAKVHEEIMMNRYSDACAKWTPERGGFPQIAFYGYHKSYGYVTFDLEAHSSSWRRTKKKSIEAYKRMMEL